MSLPPGAVEVFVFQGGKFLGSRCFSQNTIVIGRDANATLRLRDASISGRHAVVRIEGGSVVLADNNSASGVLVNGEPVSVRRINSFDEVTIGPFRLKLTLLGSKDEDPGFGPADDSDDRAEVGRRADAGRRAPASGGSTAPLEALESADQATQVRRREEIQPEATVPRIHRTHVDQQALDEFDDDAETRASKPLREPRPRGDQFDAGRSLHREQRATRQPGPRDGQNPFPAPSGRGRATADDRSHERRGHSEDELERHSGPADPMSEMVGAPLDEEPNRDQRLDAMADAPPALDGSDPNLDDLDYDGAVQDDDDDDEPFVEPFSLLENIVRERFKTPTDTEPFMMTEVIRYRDGQLIDLMRANPGQVLKILPDDHKLIHVFGDGRARLFFRESFSGTVVRKGKARPLKRLIRAETLINKSKGIYAVDLQEGDYAQIVRDDAGYLVRFVKPPVVPKGGGARLTFNWANIQIFAGSAAFHFLILVMLGFAAPQADLYVEDEQEKFIKTALKDPKLEKPKEEPKKEEPPKSEKPKPKPTKPKPTKTTRRVVRRSKATPQVSAARKAKVQRKQAENVLSALRNLKPSGGPGRSSLKSLTTNIAAVRSAGGASSRFKISGVIGKVPGGGVRIAAGLGRGGKGTRVGRQLLAGGKIGKLSAIAGTGKRVRGRVRKAPTRSIRAHGGVLSREAIQRVVAKHMRAVQACYERQLLTTPGLAGKIVFDWTITTSGSVGTARQVSSSLRSAAVSSCILRNIRTWRFPKPMGGSVQVRYPFVFRVQGF